MTRPEEQICNNLRKISDSTTQTIRILDWLQAATAILSVALAVYFGVISISSKKSEPKDGGVIAVTNNSAMLDWWKIWETNGDKILLVSSTVFGTTSLGVLGRLKRAQKQDLIQTHQEMDKYCPRNRRNQIRPAKSSGGAQEG